MIAFIIKKYKVEEKYIQPNIEDKISVKQNPKLLSAIEKFDQNNHEGALIDLNEFLQKNPNHLDANIILSQIYIKMNQKDEMRKVNKKIISIYLNEKNNDLALSTYLDIKKMIPDFVLSPREQIHMAHLLEKEGNIVDVADAYERLIEKYPTANESMKAAVTYGNLCLNRLNQPEKALTLFQRAKERCDFYPEWTNRMEEGLKAALDKLNKGKKLENKEKSPDAAEKQIITFEMRLTKLYENGILLEGDNNRGLFKWEQIKYIGIGNIHLNHTNGNYRKIIDLVFELAPNIIKVVRIKEEEIEYKELFKNSQDDRNQEFYKLIRILYHYSKTSIVPPPCINDEQYAEFVFSEFPSLESYEASLISSLP
jgi:tetratricopeptide (TPR) repeat protein